MSNIKLLDCTLRDGAYIVDAKFGTAAIRGITRKLEKARVEIIECGWLKDKPHEEGTSFFHVPSDLEQYIGEKKQNATYVVMIDWDRYDLQQLPVCDHKSIDAIRVVFPKGHFKEGIALCQVIKDKGYDVYLQAANTLGYSDEELVELAKEVNKAKPVALSVVDTFGAMYEDDLMYIVDILEKELEPSIALGFHSHNNQQLSFALSMQFVNTVVQNGRDVIIDASLCGMGRGAGNATTELISSFLNKKHDKKYDLDYIMDAIDVYMSYFKEKYTWGYSTEYFIAGMYCTHVNNIAYLTGNHRCNARTMRNIIASLTPEKRLVYDYDNLENVYVAYQGKDVDDSESCQNLYDELKNREIVLVAPGKSSEIEAEKIKTYAKEMNAVVIAVNAICEKYSYDYLLFANSARYDYFKTKYPDVFADVPKILLSSIKAEGKDDEIIINYEKTIKRGWPHFDNAVIIALRFLDRIGITKVSLSGFDGFKHSYNESYADPYLPSLNPDNKWDELNEEIKEMYQDFVVSADHLKEINFLTESMYK